MGKLKKIFIDYTENNKIIVFRYLVVGASTTIINIVYYIYL